MLTVQRRSDNGRIFGGYIGIPYVGHGSYYRRSGDPAFLFRLDPGQNDIDFLKMNQGARHYDRRVWYGSTQSYYGLTFGGGHDLSCEQHDFRYCYANVDHDYSNDDIKNNGRYGSGYARSYLTGSYSWNGRSMQSES